MAAKLVIQAVLFAVSIAASALVIVVFWVHSEADCKPNCSRLLYLKLASLITWFVTWEAWLLTSLRTSLRGTSKAARGFLPIISAVIVSLVTSFSLFWITMIVAMATAHPMNTNFTISTSNTTICKDKIVEFPREKNIIHCSFMMLALFVFSVNLCSLMFPPRRGVQSKPQSTRKDVVKIGCKTISTIVKEPGNHEKVQLEA